jgi:outer membrane protein assembly factor BamB
MGSLPPFSKLWTSPAISADARVIEHGATVTPRNVFVTSIDGTTVALSTATGEVVWRRLLVGGEGHFATAPAYADGRLYVNARRPGRVWALDAATGAILWRRELGGNSEGGPLVVGKNVYLTLYTGQLVKYSPRGRRMWSRYLGCSVTAGPTWTGRYLVSADRCGHVSAFRPSGSLAWRRDLGAPSGAHALVNHVRGRLYVNTKENRLFALRPRDGRILWIRRTGSGIAYGSCAATQRRVWCGNGAREARVRAWSSDGRLLWERVLSSSGSIMGDVVRTRGLLWVCDFKNSVIHVLNPGTGSKIKKMRRCRYTPVVASGSVVYHVSSNEIEALQGVLTADGLKAPPMVYGSQRIQLQRARVAGSR